MTVLTITSLVLVVLGGGTRLGWPRALALSGATPAGAALVLGDIAVPTFDFVALFAIVAFALRALRPRDRLADMLPPVAGLQPLVLFGLWSVMITLIAPVLFEGMAVTGPDIGAIHFLNSAIQPATSNIAQLAYLSIAVAAVALVARDRATAIDAVGLVFIASTLLSFWALLGRDFGVPFPVGVFDNSPAFRYIDSAPGGAERFRGIFPEPAALATVSLATIAFLVAYLPRSRGRLRTGAVVVLGCAIWNAAVSTATTLIISGLLLALLALGFFGVRFFLSGLRVGPGLIVVMCVAGSMLVLALPTLANALATTLGEKVDSTSYDQRSFADNFSYGLVLQTFGLGVGLGSNRPSSFLAALLSTTGIVGTALFIVALAVVLVQAAPIRSVSPVMWAFISLLISKIISAPDLGDPTGLTWLCLGVLSHAVTQRDAEAASSFARVRLTEPPRVQSGVKSVLGGAVRPAFATVRRVLR
ncbi:hypothetical protein [uncultured Amnibacterium sp.]|uniref:hypothetical protein n=1 Tax=uncultured Amnibacterium sp. TaxID=1631851 RepID=UPI0035CA7705